MKLFPVVSALFMLAASPSSRAAPQGITNQKVTLELKEVKINNLFRLLADISQKSVMLDACVKEEEVDLSLRNVPVGTVFDVLATRFGLTYRTEADVIHVGCAGAELPPDPRLETRLTVDAKEVRLEELLDVLARGAGLERAQCKANCDARVSLTLKNVRARNVAAAVGDMANVRLSVVDNVLVVDPL